MLTFVNVNSVFIKSLIVGLLSFGCSLSELNAQNDPYVDSLTQIIKTAKTDTARIQAQFDISRYYVRNKPDTTLIINRDLVKKIQALDANKYKEFKLFLLGSTASDNGIANYFLNEFDKAYDYADTAIGYFNNLDEFESMAASLNLQGVILEKKGELDKALEKYKAILENKEALAGTRILGAAANNIGLILTGKGDLREAIKYYTESINIKKELNDSKGISTSYSNIGLIYNKLKEYDNAKRYFRRGLSSDLEAKNYRGIASAYNNLGTVYHHTEVFDSAIYYYLKGAELRDSIGDNYGISSSYNNLGSLHMNLAEKLESVNMDSAKRYAQIAIDYIMPALEIREKIGDINGMASCLNNLGVIQERYFDLNKGIEYCKRAHKIAVENNLIDREMFACSCLSEAYQRQGNLAAAFPYYKRSVELDDSLNNLEKSKEVNQTLMEYEYLAKKMQDSLANVRQQEARDIEEERKELAYQQENEKQKMYTYTGIGLALIMLFLFVVMFRSYRAKKKANIVLEDKNELISRQKEEVENSKLHIEEQKEIIEEKNKDITDSIRYAQRIQEAMLPSNSLIKKYFPESFVLYLPKDIVAGDFYWLQTGSNSDDVFIAAADCTGHGVPGAMVSVVCSNALDSAIKEFKLNEPADILDKVRDIVIDTLSGSDEQESEGGVKDGMDISLARINTKSLEITWAGAHNPLWIFRKSDSNALPFQLQNMNNGYFCEFPADKQPIGRFEINKPFTNHSAKLQAGDMLYLFSDGYADQFGGDKGKKMKIGNFKSFLAGIYELSADEQLQKLDTNFINWKGDYEQLDDVCIIGVQL